MDVKSLAACTSEDVTALSIWFTWSFGTNPVIDDVMSLRALVPKICATCLMRRTKRQPQKPTMRPGVEMFTSQKVSVLFLHGSEVQQLV